ncbi:MAG: MGMT family protein [Spirochaetales bacterium]|nr:MGMT family protein [Spirochaetales bacterium]
MLKEEVYNAVKLIPRGKVSTYGDIAAYLGNPNLARVVGNVLHVNPYEGIVPCHRVVNAKGHLARNFGFGGLEGQRRRLEEEGVVVTDGKVDLREYRFQLC